MTDDSPMPVFVLKARDNLALPAMEHYRDLCREAGLERQAQQVEMACREVMLWRWYHPDECKNPDHDHVPAGQPGSGSDSAPLGETRNTTDDPR